MACNAYCQVRCQLAAICSCTHALQESAQVMPEEKIADPIIDVLKISGDLMTMLKLEKQQLEFNEKVSHPPSA